MVGRPRGWVRGQEGPGKTRQREQEPSTGQTPRGEPGELPRDPAEGAETHREAEAVSDRRFSVRLVPGRSRGTWERDEIRGQDPAAGALAMLLQRRRRLHWRTLLAGLKPRDVWKAVELLE